MKYTQALYHMGGMLMLVVLLFPACKKDLGGDSDRAAPEQQMSMSRENQIAGISREIAAILEKVYLDPDACYEVNAAIYAGYYEDERVLLKDLLYPEISELYALDKFKKFRVRQGWFRKLFYEALDKGVYPFLKSQLKASEFNRQRLLDRDRSGTDRPIATRPESASSAPMVNSVSGDLIFSTALGAAIYFPYSQNFEAVYKNGVAALTSAPIAYQTPTIVYTDREADAGPGKERYACGTRFSLTACFRQVIVNDDYAYGRPTHIVAVGAQPSVVINPENEAPAGAVSRVYHGMSRLTQQLDRLISLTGNGGGSEVKVARVSAYLTVKDQQVTNFSGDVATVYYKRGDIRNKRWKRIYSLWDANWQEENKQQVYAVYEDDTQGTKKFKGSLSTTINIPGKPSLGKSVGDISYEISVTTQDEIITQRMLDRYSYLRDAFNSQGGSYAPDPDDFLPAGKDWPILDGGTIWNYTMPYRIF